MGTTILSEKTAFLAASLLLFQVANNIGVLGLDEPDPYWVEEICGSKYVPSEPQQISDDKTFELGKVIPVEITIPKDGVKNFEFKLCINEYSEDLPLQRCFDQNPLSSRGFRNSEYTYHDKLSITYFLRSPQITCEQCILQWTYIMGTKGICNDGSVAIGCGTPTIVKDCADIKIVKNKQRPSRKQTKSVPIYGDPSASEQPTNGNNQNNNNQYLDSYSGQGVPQYSTQQRGYQNSGINTRQGINTYTCYPTLGASRTTTVKWCIDNCYHATPYCPKSHCICPEKQQKK